MPINLTPTRKGPFKKPKDKKEAYYIKEFVSDKPVDKMILDPEKFQRRRISGLRRG